MGRDSWVAAVGKELLTLLPTVSLLIPVTMLIGQSHDFNFGGHMVYNMALVVSFVPERSEGANDATRDSNKLYA